MISVLLVEDNDHKSRAIKECLLPLIEGTGGVIHIEESLVAARDALSRRQYDLLILDLAVPNRKGDDPENDGGLSLLKEINASKTLIKPGYVIGLTAYDELVDQQKKEFSDYLWAVLHFDFADQKWSIDLKKHVGYLIQSVRYTTSNRSDKHDFDVGIVVALPKPELSAVLDSGMNWSPRRIAGSTTSFYEAACSLDGCSIRFVAAASPQMGNVASAVLASEMIASFRPKLMVLVGICAGSNIDGQKLLDIAVSDEVLLHDSGKIISADGRLVLQPDPKSLPISPFLKSVVHDAVLSGEIMRSVNRQFGFSEKQSLDQHVGPVASGTCVLAAKEAVDEIRARARKVKAIEMEGYGFAYACTYAGVPDWVLIKGICDFANIDKDDDYQSRAATISVRYVMELVKMLSQPPRSYFNT